MMTELLNWYSSNEDLVKGLREAFVESSTDAKDATDEPVLLTIRDGTKYADKLNPGDLVDVSISNNPEEPNVIGRGTVLATKKGTIAFFAGKGEYLGDNIGAKTWPQVRRDMDRVYPHDVLYESVVSMIYFTPNAPTS